MSQRQVFSTIFVTLFVALMGWLLLIIKPFLTIIAWAIILAQLAYPLHDRVRRHLTGRETMAALISTVTITLLVVLPSMYLVILGVQESLDAYNALSAWLQQDGLQRAGESLSRMPVLGRLSQRFLGRVIVAHGNVELSIVEATKWLSTFVVTGAGGIVKNVVLVGTDFLIMLLTLLFLFRDGPRFYQHVHDAIPLDSQHKERITDHLNTTVTAVIRGTVLTALAQGVLAGITYAILGAPFPVFLGALSALLAFLPIGGTALVWGPLMLWFVALGAYLKAVILLIMGAALIGLMDNVLYYWFTGSHARLPMLLLFFASMGGIAYFGFIGLFLGPLLLAVVVAMFQIYQEDYREKKLIAANEPVTKKNLQ